MATISGSHNSHQQQHNSHANKKSTRKESPDPPPRELILASPDLRLNSKSRLSWSSVTTYFDCLGPKRMFVSTKRTRYALFGYEIVISISRNEILKSCARFIYERSELKKKQHDFKSARFE